MHYPPTGQDYVAPSPTWPNAGHDTQDIGWSPSSSGFLAILAAFASTGGTSRGDTLASVLKQHRAKENASLARLMVSGRVFCFPWRSSLWVPMFQFDLRDLSLKEEPRLVRNVLEPRLKEWELAAWFARPHFLLQGQRPVLLLDTQLDAVLNAAQHGKY